MRKRLKNCNRIAMALIIVGVIILIIIETTTTALVYNYLSLACLAVAVGGCVYGYVTIRCTYCNHSLWVRGRLPKYCPKCGKKIDD